MTTTQTQQQNLKPICYLNTCQAIVTTINNVDNYDIDEIYNKAKQLLPSKIFYVKAIIQKFLGESGTFLCEAHR